MLATAVKSSVIGSIFAVGEFLFTVIASSAYLVILALPPLERYNHIIKIYGEE